MTELRLADAPTTEVSMVIAATPDRLWSLVTDINLPARFSPEFQGAEWLDGATGPSVGARFRGRNQHTRIGEWQVTCTIVECETERVVAWAVEDVDAPSAMWRFTLEPVEGGTNVTQWCQMGPGRSGLSMAIDQMPDREHDILTRRLAEHAANMQKNLEGLASLV